MGYEKIKSIDYWSCWICYVVLCPTETGGNNG